MVDLFSEMGVTEVTVGWDISEVDGLTLACMDLIKKTRVAATKYPVSAIQVLCSEDFWEELITNAETREAFKLYQDNAFARQQAFEAFNFKGVTFRPLWGGVGSIPFIAAGKGRSFPIAPIYKRFNAPAPFNETVNTVGKPLYAKQRVLDFDVGVELHTNSNPLHLCILPATLMRVDMI